MTVGKNNQAKPTAIIIGAGPAGLTAAYELLKRTDIVPIVIEREELVGGISKTVPYKGNRMDLGGHRFFSKSDRVMEWWKQIMPLDEQALQSEGSDRIMMVRDRISRIYFLRRFFDYPISLSMQTIRNLGFARMSRIGVSYFKARLFPIKKEKSLEDFYINRFGKELYNTFFRDYTKKVWGVDCSEISPDWGSQRVKGLSVGKAIGHMMKSLLPKRSKAGVSQKDTETSLIEKFLYPKYGPGQLWECVADDIEDMGGKIIKKSRVTAIHTEGDRVTSVTVTDGNGNKSELTANLFISSMPVRELIGVLDSEVPAKVKEISEGLIYRDFMTAGLLLNKMDIQTEKGYHPDTWIYIQERDVMVGRVQIFNNWSPYMVADSAKVWIGLEYFVNEGDSLWTMSDSDFLEMASRELEQIGLIKCSDVLDGTVVRVEKAYPAYFGTYDRIDEIRHYLDGFPNLYLIGRNGMHKYNNMDHSMLTAMTVVDNIVSCIESKDNIWAINTEQEYSETKKI